MRIHRIQEEVGGKIPSKRRYAKKGTSPNGKLAAFSCYTITILLVLGMAYEASEISSAQIAAQTLTAPELMLTALFSFFLSFIAMSYMFIRGNTLEGIVESLGLSRDKFSVRMLAYGVVIFIMIFLLEIVLTLISQASGVAINTNTQLLLGGAPLWFLIFATFITPINEEIFFRGFLIKGIAHISAMISGTNGDFDSNSWAAWSGIIVSAILFGLSHASYDSTFGVDMLAAGIFAIIAGYVFKKTKSLYPSMFAHMLVNLLAVLAFLG